MLLSIIIPAFQIAAELSNALYSIESQNFDDFEIIILDACSTDNIVEVVERFKYLPVSLVQEHDFGVYDAMNKGIAMAKGKWLYFMGGDDLLKKDILSNLRNIFNSNVDFIYGNVVLKSNNSIYDGEFNLNKLLCKRNICHQAAFYSKRTFEVIGPYNLAYPIWSDWDMNIRIFKHPHIKKVYVNSIVAVYNDEYGVSSKPDNILAVELPVYYINKIKALEFDQDNLNKRVFLLQTDINTILNSNAFVIGNRIIKLLKRFKLTGLIKILLH